MRIRRAHLIIPEEPRVECRATIFHKEVCEALEDVSALERFEQAEDDVEIARPATAHAGDRLGAQTGGLPVLGPHGVVGAHADEDGNAQEGKGYMEP